MSNERQTEFEKCWPYNKHLINLVFSVNSSVRSAKTWRAYTIFCITNPNGPYMQFLFCLVSTEQTGYGMRPRAGEYCYTYTFTIRTIIAAKVVLFFYSSDSQ